MHRTRNDVDVGIFYSFKRHLNWEIEDLPKCGVELDVDVNVECRKCMLQVVRFFIGRDAP